MCPLKLHASRNALRLPFFVERCSAMDGLFEHEVQRSQVHFSRGARKNGAALISVVLCLQPNPHNVSQRTCALSLHFSVRSVVNLLAKGLT